LRYGPGGSGQTNISQGRRSGRASGLSWRAHYSRGRRSSARPTGRRAGRISEGRHIFEKMLTYANQVGLFAEEIGRAKARYPAMTL
jgi:hypothetical protein